MKNRKIKNSLKPWIACSGYLKKWFLHNQNFFHSNIGVYVFLTNIKMLTKIFPKCIYFKTEGEFVEFTHSITGKNIDVFYIFKPFTITVNGKKYKNKYSFAICDAVTALKLKLISKKYENNK